VLPPIGQSHPKQPLVHVLGRPVSSWMSAVNFAASSDCHEGGTGAAPHPDPVGPYPEGSTVVGPSKRVRLSTVARYSYQVCPRRSANSRGPVTVKVSHRGIVWTSAASNWRRSSARSPAVARSRCSYGSALEAENGGHGGQRRSTRLGGRESV
jgi:hypothetical protein